VHILYLDESGDPYVWDSQKNFVIGGAAIYEDHVYHLTRRLDEIQANYFPERTYPINLHATEIHGGKPPFRELGSEKQHQLLNDVYELISESTFPRLIIFATVVHVSWVKSPGQVVHDAFQDVCKRFNTRLDHQASVGKSSRGLLIIDEAHEPQYKELLREFQLEGTRFGRIDNITDVPYFARSTDTRMIQLADFVCWATFRAYEHADFEFFDMIKEKIDRRAVSGPFDGLNHLTKVECNCLACQR
jgi:hypothetical protein